MSLLGKLPFPFSHSSSSSADAPGPSATPERRPSRLHQRLSSIGSIGKKSLRRRKKSLSSSEASSSYHPYAVYYQNMLPLLRDPAVLKTVLESILEMPGGKRMLSRMARTCRALSDPVLNMLWKELDSLIPLLGLFPGSVLKKARKPGLGMQRAPQPEEWKKVLKYGERVRRLTYIESAGNVSPNVFPIIEQHRPRTYILPNLLTLVWRVETPAGLDRAALFLNPELMHMTLEVGTRVPQLDAFLADLSRRTKLLSFSFTSATPLPDKFTELLAPQDALERVMLSAPGALSADVGRWASTLQHLQSLRLDLSERTQAAAEGFFDEVPRSGVSTPASAHTDSGVFSDDERDTKDLRKDSARLTAHARPRGAFARLRHLHLTGQAGAIAVFLKHMTSPLVQLELVIEDPPEKNAWRELSGVISERYASSLATLRVSATGASRFTDLLRNTTRDPPSKHLPLQHLGPLSRLARLEIDLPESVIFTRADVEHVAQMCPRLENVKLCPFARFPIGTRAPLLGLNDLVPLTTQCRRLQSLAVVIDARKGWSEILEDRNATSTSLRHLHFGHSWIGDPLPVSVALSHLAPRLEGMRWFHDRTRPGLHEPHARAWQQVADGLPMLQHVRLTERKRSRGVYVRPSQASTAVDATPVTVSTGVSAVVRSRAQEVDATPRTSVASIEAIVAKSSQSVATEPEEPPAVSQPPPSPPPTSWPNALLRRSATILPNLPGPRQIIAVPLHLMNPFFVIPAMLNLMSFACRLFILYPLTLPIRVLHAVLRLFLVRGRRVLGRDPRAPGNGPRPPNGRPDGLLSGDSRSPSAPRLGSRLPSLDGKPRASVELQDMKTVEVPVNVNGADCVEPGLRRTTPYEESYEMDTLHVG
ncbi:uncharacterized protein SCHCODRAFT_02487032 [Schizophyllum commune H4-8]|uniref:uncharacterized protein n=1 Tax=Schizophyllum commune (strain H4-8 / FGSC 9210) TaxID=578458 RepID=UPI00215E9B55|nr:uncharacterized protein SCHCODRAFT_02487032 [Schizophyllum commune H4-8]KAI5897867.1 hypothetical protein SCHCODRAFT_02487032 [Schizophyllum commune H4-8]